jgi:peroxiredoxin
MQFQKSLFAALFILLALSLGSSIFAQTTPKSLPSFTFETLTGQALTPANLNAKGKPIIVVYFDPDCDHCQKQARYFAAAKERFQGVKFLYVTIADKSGISTFHKTYFGASGLDVTFGLDTQYRFDEYFGYSQVPSVYAYNAAGQLVGSWKEDEVPADVIAKALGK